jgi:hypothetical protein
MSIGIDLDHAVVFFDLRRRRKNGIHAHALSRDLGISHRTGRIGAGAGKVAVS